MLQSMLPIFTFGASLVLMVGILAYQNRQIRLGKVDLLTADDPFDLPVLRNIISNWLSQVSRQIFLDFLKTAIRIHLFVKKQKEHSREKINEVGKKIKTFFERKKKTGPVSEFLATISHYKTKIKEIKEEIEKEK